MSDEEGFVTPPTAPLCDQLASASWMGESLVEAVEFL